MKCFLVCIAISPYEVYNCQVDCCNTQHIHSSCVEMSFISLNNLNHYSKTVLLTNKTVHHIQ